MATGRVELEPAYVLHQRAYRDTSVIVDVLTAHHGRIGLVANGARRPKSRFNGLLQLFQPLLVSWSQKGELGTLTQLEAVKHAPTLSGRMLINGLYVNELLMYLLPREEPHSALYAAYQVLLDSLMLIQNDSETNDQRKIHAASEQWALRLFEKRLLSDIGYGLMLEHEAGNGALIQVGARYRYEVGVGPVLCLMENASHNDRGIVVKGESLMAFARETYDHQTDLAEIKYLMRSAIDVCLAGKPVNSRKLLARKHR